MRRNLNKRPIRYNTKLIEIVTITILLLFSIWLLTACSKEQVYPIQTPEQKIIEESKRKNDSILAVYDTMKLKTITSTPCIKNKGVIYGLQDCRRQNSYSDVYSTTQSKADQEALNNDIDNYQMKITLYDSLVVYNNITTRTLFAKLTTYGYKYFYLGKNYDPTVANSLSWSTINSSTSLQIINNELYFPFSGPGYFIKTTINKDNIKCQIGAAGKTADINYCNLKYQ